MKTTELIEKLRDYAEPFTLGDDVIFGMYWTVSIKEQKLSVHGVIPIPVLKLLGEYINTRIEKREEEKKYYICFTDDFWNEDLYLNLDTEDWKYFFDEKTNCAGFETIFSDDDISDMPKEIQGAIACGFLVKVEVE